MALQSTPWLARFDQCVHRMLRRTNKVDISELVRLVPELVGKALTNQHRSQTVLADLCIKEST